MHLPSVKLFLEVSEAGSISKVAARRHTVQSHISRQISEFEASLGGPLLRRTGRGVTLTPLGARAALRLRSWLQETEQLQETLRADAGQLWGDRKSTRLNSSHLVISYAVFCLKKKK